MGIGGSGGIGIGIAGESITPAYGSLNEDNPAGTAITCTTAGTYYQWVTSIAGLNNYQIVATGGATGTLAIQPSCNGIYEIVFSVMMLVQAGVTYDWAIFKNGTKLTTPAMNAQTLNGAANVVTLTDSDLVSLVTGDTISLWVSASSNGAIATIRQATLMMHRVRNL